MHSGNGVSLRVSCWRAVRSSPMLLRDHAKASAYIVNSYAITRATPRLAVRHEQQYLVLLLLCKYVSC